MRRSARLAAAALLALAAAPLPCRAGGAVGENPYEIGEKLLARRKPKTALAYFRKALDRNDPRASYGIGRALEDAGRDGEALEHFQRYVEVAPPGDPLRGDAAVRAAAIEARARRETARTGELVEKGRGLLGKGKLREAERALLQAAARDDASAEAHFLLGEVYLKLGKFEQAKTEYRKAKNRY